MGGYKSLSKGRSTSKFQGVRTKTRSPKVNKSTVKPILSRVLKKIKPTKEDIRRNHQLLTEVAERLKRATPSDVEVVLVGSVAKGTYIRNKKDFDVFLLFPRRYSPDEIKRIGLSSAKRAFRGYRHTIAYAEHPYLQVDFEGVKIDVVPAYKIENPKEKGTAVDRTPFHTSYVNNHLTEREKDEVRLLKQFMKGIGVYGAELKVEGFSGYLCELLIIKYGSFLNVLEDAAYHWDFPVMIDIEGYYQDEKEILKRFDGPLIVIDPVDRNRNVAAAVSTTSLSKFIFYSRRFLEEPSEDFFFPRKKHISRGRLKTKILSRGTELYAISWKAPKGSVEDILWPQLRRLSRTIVSHIDSLGFKVLGYYYWTDLDDCMLMIEYYPKELPRIQQIIGPKITLRENLDRFIEKHINHEDLYIEHDRIIALVKRKECDLDQVFKRITSPRDTTLPKHLRNMLRGYKRLDLDELLGRYFEQMKEYFLPTIKVRKRKG